MNNILNMMADRGRKYLTYVMALMGVITVIGLFIPITAKVSYGGFSLPAAGKPIIADTTIKAVIILLLCVAFIIASQNTKFWGTPAVVIALVVMILIGTLTKGLGVSGVKVSYGGGLGIVRASRIFMLVSAILNAGLIAFKEFVLDKKAE